MPDVFGIVLAGGEGKRLAPLTADRAKPAVPFGGNYRLIDFALSNLVNAGFRKIVVLTQYKSHSLDRHVSTTWRLSPLLGNYVAPVPAQMRRGPRWFSGSADAIYQNLNLLYDERPDYVAVFGADHIYRMDPRQMVDQHIAERRGGDRRRAARPARPGRPVRRHRDGRRRAHDLRLPREADRRRRAARRARPGLRLDGQLRLHGAGADRRGDGRRRGRELQARHGRQHRPGARRARRGAGLRLLAQRGARAPATPIAATGATSGRSTPSTTRTWTSSRSSPSSTSTTSEWPILTWPDPLPPAKFVFDEDGGRRGQALDSMVCAGVVISGATVRRSVLSPGAHMHSYAEVEDCVAHAGRRHRPARRGAPRDHRQERAHRRRARRSASTPWPTASASRSRRAAIVVIPKGATVEA